MSAWTVCSSSANATCALFFASTSSTTTDSGRIWRWTSTRLSPHPPEPTPTLGFGAVLPQQRLDGLINEYYRAA